MSCSHYEADGCCGLCDPKSWDFDVDLKPSGVINGDSCADPDDDSCNYYEEE